MELSIGMKLTGYIEGREGPLFHGEVREIRRAGRSAEVRRYDFCEKDHWYIWKKSNGSWGADCNEGWCIAEDTSLPWE